MVPPNPLAGKSGEGPPIAPKLWRWRAGTRANDMIFYSPTGERFSSKLTLRPYLLTQLEYYLMSLTGHPPPSADSFVWQITPEFLAENHVKYWDAKKRMSATKESRGSKKIRKKKVKIEVSLPAEELHTPEEKPSLRIGSRIVTFTLGGAFLSQGIF